MLEQEAHLKAPCMQTHSALLNPLREEEEDLGGRSKEDLPIKVFFFFLASPW